MEVIELTPEALERAKELLNLEKEKNSEAKNAGLRVAVTGGGCSGLQYALKFGEAKEDDTIQEYDGGFKVLIDPKSSLFLVGSTLKFHNNLNKSGFEVVNPNAANTCGCGKSFS